MKVIDILNKVSWVLLLAGAAGKMFLGEIASYIYLAAALLLVVTQFLNRARGGGFVLRRLVVQQTIGGLALVGAGVLMFTHPRNEWIVAMLVGALLELYTAYRIPQEIEKGK